ncbi:jacalin-related lectin 3-like [Lactuca sativa]|uniref:jacalin-related lectin 3-like n=1 Tax=Lactuca sativa TaxID=4236 RepID=UPI000CD86C49|nr:jacalin-related lectin 3-like [Lactuca sativa]
MMKLGPGPLRSGNNWEERGMSEIVQILISYESDRICSIQFAYVQNGGVRHSKKYGQDGRVGFDAVTFDYPSEYLTYVSGRYKDHDRLTSIVFGTNKRKYGPFGVWTDIHIYRRRIQL